VNYEKPKTSVWSDCTDVFDVYAVSEIKMPWCCLKYGLRFLSFGLVCVLP
jgi:hypothetical protein